MILGVDIGNTSIKIALVAGGRVRRRGALPSPTAKTGGIRREIGRVLAGATGRVTAAAVSSVVPGLVGPVVAQLDALTGLRPIVITNEVALPIELGVRHPEKIGADRICAACGVIARGRRNAIVVDAGSAVTVDLVVGRRLRGGVILAGPDLSLSALHRGTGGLPDVPPPSSLFPRRFDDTESAMILGAGLGTVGGIREAVGHLRRSAEVRATVFVTGGRGRALSRRLPQAWILAPDLVFEGVGAIVAAGTRS